MPMTSLLLAALIAVAGQGQVLGLVGEPGIGISARSMRQARKWLAPDELRPRTAEHRARLREERRRRRASEGVFRQR